MEKDNEERIGEKLKIIFSNNLDEYFIFDEINNYDYTFRNFFELILRCKEKLERLQMQKKDSICIISENCVEIIIIYFTCLLLQIKIIPLDPMNGKKYNEDIILRINPKLIIYDKIWSNNLKNIIQINKLVEKEHNAGIKNLKNKLNIFEKIDANIPFLITFTSGTTGEPKGVIHSFGNLYKSANAFKKIFQFGSSNIFYHNLPMTYMAGILNLIILPLVSASKIVIVKRFSIIDINSFWKIPIKYKVNTFWFIPTIIELLIKLDRNNMTINKRENSTTIACVGTAPLNIQSKKEFEEKYNIKLYETYGLSETLFVTANYLNKNKDGSVGIPLEGVELKFLKDSEIIITTPWTSEGYYNINNEKIIQKNEFHSGDLGHYIENKNLVITGRKKDIIIRGGVNISPKKIEDHLNFLKHFNEIVVIGIKDRIIGEKTVCFFVSEKNILEEKLKQINLKIIKNLGIHHNIDEFIRIKTIPKNLNGKIDKKRILKIYYTK